MGFNTTDGKLYLIGLRTLQRVEFQFVPKNVKIDRKANYSDAVIVSRNDPIPHFVSGRTTMPLALEFYSDREDRTDVRDIANLLKRFAYGDGNRNGPEKVKLIFGDLVNDIDKWIITSVNVTYSHFQRHREFLPQRATIQLNLQQDPDSNLTFDQVL